MTLRIQNGNLVVGQSGGPTSVINASLAGVISEAKKLSLAGIYGMIHGIEGAISGNYLNLGSISDRELGLLKTTPASALGSCRHKLQTQDYVKILENFRKHNVRYFVYIGGNDSMDTCSKIAALAKEINYDMQIIGIPKTIDNDLVRTDHTPGYGSAAKFVAWAVRDVARDLEAMSTFDDVMLFETLGRNAGWLAASSVLGKEAKDDAPHIICLPEVDFDQVRFLDFVSDIHAKLGYVFIVVCEGIKDKDGYYVGFESISDQYRDSFGHSLVTLTSGVASYLSDLIANNLSLQTRFLRPGFIGRSFSACVSMPDLMEAYDVGTKAVRLISEDKSGLMVSIQRVNNDPYELDYQDVMLEDVANKEKHLPEEFIESFMVNENFRKYALPLIGGSLDPIIRLSKNVTV